MRNQTTSGYRQALLEAITALQRVTDEQMNAIRIVSQRVESHDASDVSPSPRCWCSDWAWPCKPSEASHYWAGDEWKPIGMATVGTNESEKRCWNHRKPRKDQC